MSNALTRLSNTVGTPDALDEFARFADDVADVLTDAPDAPDSLAELDPPAVDADEISVPVDPDDLPDGVDPDEVEREQQREYPGCRRRGTGPTSNMSFDRPLLADETKHAYLLTNVPTDLHVDEVCTFEELVDPVEALLPVPEGALDLAKVLADVEDGSGPEGFRPDAIVETTDDGVRFHVREVMRLARVAGVTARGRTEPVSEDAVRRWVNGLVDLSILNAGRYIQRRGVAYDGDFSTLASALSVIGSNAGAEVAISRRIAALAAEADGTLEWLRHAREAFGLAGDRCDRDPPPTPTG